MHGENGIKITQRDRLLRGWEKSTELVRDYQAYADECKGKKELNALFSEFAQDEAVHAARLLELLHTEQEEREKQ